jgi:hypothetical protein
MVLNMSEAEAHKFVAQWKRILLPWLARTEVEALRDMERSCIGMTGGGVLMCIMASTRMAGSSFWQAAALLGLCQFGVSLLLVLRFRAARRVLNKSQIVNHKS